MVVAIMVVVVVIVGEKLDPTLTIQESKSRIQETGFIIQENMFKVQENGFTTPTIDPMLQKNGYMMINPVLCPDPMEERNPRKSSKKDLERYQDQTEVQDQGPIQEENKAQFEVLEEAEEEIFRRLASGE